MSDISDKIETGFEGAEQGSAEPTGTEKGSVKQQRTEKESAEQQRTEKENAERQHAERGRPVGKRNVRLWRNMGIFACVLGGIVLLGTVGPVIKTAIFGDGKDYTVNGPYVAALYVEGTIASGQTNAFGAATGYQHQWTLNKIEEIRMDPENRGLMVFIDSPGGGVYESDELYLALNEYRIRTGRPVYAAMGSTAASGGYYIATAADKIIANRNTWTGSIGVTIGTLYDLSGLLERYGVKTITITSGANKSMGSSVTPLTREQQDIFQSLVDEAYDQFVGIVAEERGMELETVKKIADGRIYTAKQAQALGLVDAIGTMQDALDDMYDRYDLWGCDVIDIVYHDNSFWGNILRGVATPDPGGDVSALLKIVEGNQRFPVSYFCELLDR